MKVFTEESALDLAEQLLQNDKNIRDELIEKIPTDYLSSIPSQYVTETELKSAIANAQLSGDNSVDLSNYYNRNETDILLANLASTDYVDRAVKDVDVDLTGYVKEEQLSDYAPKSHTHDEYLTEHQDLSDYALKSEIPTDYLSSIPDEYITESEMTEAINNAKLEGESVDLSDYAKKTDIPTTLPASDVYDWAKAEEKPTYTAVEVGALPADTSIPSIEGLATEEYVTEAIAQAQLNNGGGSSETTTIATKGFRDELVIPDKYNTGVDSSVELTVCDADKTIGTVTSDDGGKAPYIQYRTDAGYFCINGYSNTNLAMESVIEGYDFSEMKFTTTNNSKYTESKTITFKNCKFKSFVHDSVALTNLSFIFENCTFSGQVGYSNITLNNCYIRETNCTDGAQPLANFYMNNCYIANPLNKCSTSGAHVDGVQFIGTSAYETKDVTLNNVRFGLCQFYWDGTNTSDVNAAIMVSLENNNASGLLFQNCIVDMGGRYTPFYCCTKNDAFTLSDVTFKDITITDNYEGNSSLFYTGSYYEDTVVDNVACSSTLYVSSVWKDEDNKTHIICTNSSVKSTRTLKVVTNLGEYEFEMERSPSQNELLTDATYQAYTWDNMPYDIDCVINEDVDHVICYDKESGEQIRFVNFTDEDVILEDDNGFDLSNYYTKDETYSKTEVDELISAIKDSENSGGSVSDEVIADAVNVYMAENSIETRLANLEAKLIDGNEVAY